MGTVRQHGDRRRGGLTLIEALLTVTLLAVLAGLGAGSVAGASAGADLAEAAGAMRDLDRLARLHARAGGAVVLAVDALAHEATVARAGVVLARRGLPRRAVVSVDPPGGVHIGADGRGEDYGVSILLGSRRVAWTVRGLTGWVSGADPGGRR